MGIVAAHDRASQVRQAGRLELAQIAKKGTSGTHGRGIGRLQPEAVERRHAEPARQFLPREVGIELPRLPRSDERRLRGWRIGLTGRGYHQLGGVEPGQRLAHGGNGDRLQHEFAGAEIDGREADGLATRFPRRPAGYRHHPVVAAPRQPPVHQQGTGGDGFDHFAADQPLREARIFHLLADGDPLAGRHQLPEIVGRRLHRYAGEGNAVTP